MFDRIPTALDVTAEFNGAPITGTLIELGVTTILESAPLPNGEIEILVARPDGSICRARGNRAVVELQARRGFHATPASVG